MREDGKRWEEILMDIIDGREKKEINELWKVEMIIRE